ncbi:alkyl hydroperoxide reductase AhpD [Actinoplanes ianthinogenes]|uniref:Alkyl hydroperoxide reductase AhpD n=1 Tax=Actinoplanes ianthinogenes TaxID=122358 RepID=A0ABM7LPJ7_9ACTN|nr:carboxymuconolactone decarboxylase family protein [Actinoplanes ianthinogenes]BCJ41162.1 alkyl hydroperoxide reductase AhpD [Actinoplanes ianthinogenes]GGR22479.1 alkyl hydroperoxide reductase AhpD [Actinoplanes ianthinogenes]
MASIFALAVRRLVLRQVRHLGPVRPGRAPDRVAAVCRQMEAEFGMPAPPVALHAAAPEVLDAVWLVLRETLLAGDPADRAAKEAVAAAVSLANSCPYCVEVHGATLIGTRRDDDARRIAEGRLDEVRDPALRALAGWARDGAPIRLRADRAAIVTGVAVTFHYLNRVVNVFLPETPLADVPVGGRDAARRVAASVFGRLARAVVPPGRAVTGLPPRPLPDDLGWAAPVATIADALARAAAAIDEAGAAVLPAAVRDLVLARLADPAETGPGLAVDPWIAVRVAPLSPADRPAARLALLVAFASYRVTDRDIASLRAAGHGDDALVRVAAWAAMAAARRAACLLSGRVRPVTDIEAIQSE